MRAILLSCVVALILPHTAGAQRVDTIMVSVHGHRIALFASGSGPTVVMEAGGGSWSRDWTKIAPVLAASARVITYDRPGYGLSEPCDQPRTAARASRELHDALQLAGIRAPYTMVGWSLGGAIARVHAGHYPAAVVGLVLVDPAPEEFYPAVARDFPDEWSREVEGGYTAIFSDSTRRGFQRELAAFDASMHQARASDASHRTPTMVLIADREGAADPVDRVWIAELQRWSIRRPNTTYSMVGQSGHHIPLQRPEAVIGAVHDMLTRMGSPPAR